MEISKWQKVIVEWVNCLNLTQTVKNVCDLKNGEFFRKLLKLINLDKTEFVSLPEFLKKHYPAYKLENEPALLQDEIEISNTYSLLLHYCCIIDGRGELTAPLCTSLTQNSQIMIKTFLEEIHEAKEITRDLLSDAIFNTNFLSYSVKSPIRENPQSPLLEFLKTPLKKQIFDSHKQEIKQLRAQLDLERFEKYDLQEELNLQYEKNKELSKYLQEKQTEIIKLRSQNVYLETSTPSSECTPEKKLETKRLRHEIQSLEKYIELMEKEQIELQQERDKAREKVRKLEENCNDLQTRALNAERNFMCLNEENQIQKNEIHNLKEKCDELTLILSEFKPKKMDESYEIDHSFDINRSGSIDCDNLARTVVDLQLSDVQEENKLLRQQVFDMERETNEITSNFKDLQSEFLRLNEKNSTLLLENREIQEKLAEKSAENENFAFDIDELKSKLTDNETKFNQLLKNCEKVNKIFEFKPTNFENDDCLLKFETFLNEIEKKFKLDSATIEKFQTNCENLSEKIQNLEDQILIICAKENDLNKKNQNFELEIENSNKLITIYKKSLEEKTSEISNLKETLKESEKKLKNEKDVCDKRNKNLNEQDKILIQNLQTEKFALKELISQKNKFIEELTNSKADLLQKLKSLEVKYFDLENSNKIIESELEQAKLNFLMAESKVEELENFIQEKSIEIAGIQINNEKIISNLQKEKQQLQFELDNKLNANSKDLLSLQNSLESSKNEVFHLRQKVEEKLIELTEKSELINKLESEKSKFLNDLSTVENGLLEQIDQKKSLRLELEQLKIDLVEKDEIIKKLECKKIELENFIKNLFEDLEQKRKSKKDLEEKCRKLQEIIGKVEDEMQILNNDKQKLNQQLETIKYNLESKYSTKQKENTNVKIEKLIFDLENAEKSNKILQKNLDQMFDNLKNKDVTIEKLEIRCEQFEQEILNLNELLFDLRQYKSDLEKKCINFDQILCEKDSKIDNLRVEKLEIEKQIEILNKHLVEQEENAKNKLKEMENLTNKLNTINVEISTIVYMFKNDEKKYEIPAIPQDNLVLTVSSLKNNICDLLLDNRRLNYASKKSHFEDVEIYQKEIHKLTENIHELKEQILQYKVQECDIKDQLETLKIELKNTVLDYQESIQEQEQIKIEHKRLQNENKSLQNTLKDLKTKITNLEEKTLDQKSKKIEQENKQLRENIEKLEEKLKNEAKLLENKEKIIEELNTKVQLENLENKKLIVEILELNTSLSKEIEQKESLNLRLSEFEFKFESFHKELTTKNLELKEMSSNNNSLSQYCNESLNKLNSLYFLVFPNEKNTNIVNFDNQTQNLTEMYEKLSRKLSNFDEICQENHDLQSKIIHFEEEKTFFEQGKLVFHKEVEDLKKILMENEENHTKLQTDYKKLQENYNLQLNNLKQQLNNNQQQIEEYENKYDKLYKEYEKIKKKINLEPELLILQEKIINYKQIIEELEKENSILKDNLSNFAELQQKNSELTSQIEKYSQLNKDLQKTIEELKEKRLKDRKEFNSLLAKCDQETEKVIQNVRCEYDEKLRKMKEKIIKLYKDELDKQKSKLTEENLLKYNDLKREYDKLHSEYTTSQKPQVIIEEVVTTVQRKRRSVTTVPPDCFPMEDEDGEVWSPTYLNDLKMGKCDSEIAPKITENRLSELQKRNSLYPPHLRSCYHTELQFTSPETVREEELKNMNSSGDYKKAICAKYNHSNQEQTCDKKRQNKLKDETDVKQMETNRRRNIIRK